MSVIDPGMLNEALADATRHQAERTLEETMQALIAGMDEVFAVKGAGLMVVDEHNALRAVLASDDAGRTLEEAQEQLGRGPCVDSLVLDEVTSTDDIAEDGRWPGLAERVVPAGVRAVLGLPVHVGGGAVGSLNVFHDEPHPWSPVEIDALDAFNSLLEVTFSNALFAHEQSRTVEQLQYALDNRVTIERAVGMIMGLRGNRDPVEAFSELRKRARSQRRPVGEVAQELLDGKWSPPAQ